MVSSDSLQHRSGNVGDRRPTLTFPRSAASPANYRAGVVRKRELSEYEAKRDFDATPEPPGYVAPRRTRSRSRGAPRFVVQEHHARSLHWDLRLERDGTLASWAVPK